MQFAGIPTFAPEHFARVTQVDTHEAQAVRQGYGADCPGRAPIQIFRDLGAGMEEVIVGVVSVCCSWKCWSTGLKNEYRRGHPDADAALRVYPLDSQTRRMSWTPKDLDITSDTRCIEDLKGNRLLLFASPWSIDWATQHNEALKLSEFGNLTF